MKTITEILKKSNSPLAKLINKAKTSQDLEIIFRATLDDASLAKYCQFANYRDSTLTVTVSNTSWATRLRFAIPDIIKNLRVQPEFKDIATIRYTVNTQTQIQKSKNKQNRIPSNNQLLWQKTLADLKKKIKHR